jgi:hypothetical protein
LKNLSAVLKRVPYKSSGFKHLADLKSFDFKGIKTDKFNVLLNGQLKR